MTRQPKDGGPAFPRAPFDVNDYAGDGSPGMTLRDWFAGQALSGDMANSDDGSWENDVASRYLTKRAALFYRIADAMVAARDD